MLVTNELTWRIEETRVRNENQGHKHASQLVEGPGKTQPSVVPAPGQEGASRRPGGQGHPTQNPGTVVSGPKVNGEMGWCARAAYWVGLQELTASFAGIS